LRTIFDKEFTVFRDLNQKMIIYEISRIRNLQYDNDNYFKEIEKYKQNNLNISLD